jgi:hypothetical protein
MAKPSSKTKGVPIPFKNKKKEKGKQHKTALYQQLKPEGQKQKQPKNVQQPPQDIEEPTKIPENGARTEEQLGSKRKATSIEEGMESQSKKARQDKDVHASSRLHLPPKPVPLPEGMVDWIYSSHVYF